MSDIKHTSPVKTILDEKDRIFTFYSVRERVNFSSWSLKKGNVEITNVTPFESKEKWDVCCRSASTGYVTSITNMIVEIKIRNHFSDKYEEWIFEKIKYDELMKLSSTEKAKRNNLIPVFVVFFKDIVVGWDVSKILQSDFKIEELRETSVNGAEKKVNKEVAYLKIKDGMFMEFFETNKYILNNKSKEVYYQFFEGNLPYDL